MISVVVPPAEKVGGENRLLRPISWTLRRALAGLVLVTPCCVPSALAGILFVYAPCVFEVTVTVITQTELGAMVPLLNATEVPPAIAVTEGDGPQPEVEALGGLARKTLAGRLSVSVTCVRLRPGSLFAMTMDSWLVPPAQIVPGLKLLLTEGFGLPVTFNVALAGVVLLMRTPPPVELNASAGMVLMRFPGVLEVTLIDTVQEPGVAADCAGTVPPVKDNVVPPAGAPTEPPQVLVKPTGLAILKPGWTAIKLSLQEALLS
jgi:hypothetical protein